MIARSASKKTHLFRAFLFPIVFCYLFITSISPAPAVDADKGSIPSYGQGPHEILIFSDYFCPPCQALEPKLEPVLDELYGKGSVNITFVDTPMHRETLLFAKFYLYAAKASPGLQVSRAGQAGSLRIGGKGKCVLDGREDRGGIPKGEGALIRLLTSAPFSRS